MHVSEDKKICDNLGSRDCEREVEKVLVKLRAHFGIRIGKMFVANLFSYDFGPLKPYKHRTILFQVYF